MINKTNEMLSLDSPLYGTVTRDGDITEGRGQALGLGLLVIQRENNKTDIFWTL